MASRLPKIRPVKTTADFGGKNGSARSHEHDGLVRELIWDLFAISSHLGDIRRVWASMMDVSGPQWLTLMAIDYLDAGKGVSVGTVSAKLHVNQTFIVSQTKMLEADGLVARRSSNQDARVVLLSLTEVARRRLAKIDPRRNEINNFIFSQQGARALKELAGKMSSIRGRLEQASLMLNIRK
jgi:DNA-binding MarR family transcriptional regulator